MANWTSLTVIGFRCHTAFMMSNSSGVNVRALFRVRVRSAIFKKFQHLPRAVLSGGVRWNGLDAKFQPAPGKLDFDRVAGSNLASRPCFITIEIGRASRSERGQACGGP